MVDVKSILDKLNTDADELKTFHSDPVGYLEKEGLSLPDDAKKQLVEHVKKNPGAKPTWNVGICFPSN